jgi:hypothetical protein
LEAIGEARSAVKDRVFAKVGDIVIVHIGEERCWNIIDDTTEEAAGKLGYFSTSIVEVKKISAMD